jgi:hypothetical protein
VANIAKTSLPGLTKEESTRHYEGGKFSFARRIITANMIQITCSPRLPSQCVYSAEEYLLADIA